MKLRHLLWATLTALAAIPVIFLGVWVTKTALDREVAAVEEKHLLVARNVTAALERYAGDAVAAFDHFATLANLDLPNTGVAELAARLGLGHVMIIDDAGTVVRQLNAPRDGYRRLPPAVLDHIRDLPPIVANRVKFKQIVVNLLSNAIKFTPSDGRITLSAELAGGAFRLRVSDTGIGMSAQQIATALTPFGQVDGSLARRYEGTGLGLPLAKRFAELFGGDLEVASQPGAGTTVTIVLPAPTGAAARAA